jgi:Cu2+-exporting ATPase
MTISTATITTAEIRTMNDDHAGHHHAHRGTASAPVAHVASSHGGHDHADMVGLHGNVLFWELATLIDIMLLGHWIEMKSVMGASGALKALVELLPATAHRFAADGSQQDVAVSDLKPGDRVLVKPGERVPSDGLIVEGRTSLDESMLTGESKPVARGPDEQVIGGSVNGEGAITVRIEKTGKDTYLSQVIDMVSRAQASRSRTQDLANRAALWLTFIAIGSGLATLAVWLSTDRGLAFAIERMVAVMVIACPHALGLAVPLVVAVSTTLAQLRLPTSSGLNHAKRSRASKRWVSSA